MNIYTNQSLKGEKWLFASYTDALIPELLSLKETSVFSFVYQSEMFAPESLHSKLFIGTNMIFVHIFVINELTTYIKKYLCRVSSHLVLFT